MTVFDRAISAIAPGAALRRARARAALSAVMRYDAAASTNRAGTLRALPTDADTAAAQRSRLAWVARDLVRNSAVAARAQSVVVGNVVGDGIIPKVIAKTQADRKFGLDLIEAHFDTTAIDAAGRNNLYGLQRLVMATVFESGECLVRLRLRSLSDGLHLPMQIEVLEPDYLDASRDGDIKGGGFIRDGIQYDGIGRRVGYWVFDTHPGGSITSRRESRLIPARDMLHIYRQDRPGQQRGVSWLAPVAQHIRDMADFQEAQIMKQKLAACFMGFRIPGDGDSSSDSDPAGLASLVPGRIQTLAPGESIEFANPPQVQGYSEFRSESLREIAGGIGVTYESLSGDLSRVNFSSARMGRMEMDRNVSAWQWLMLVPQFLQPLAEWTIWTMQVNKLGRANLSFGWVPPHRMLVDPAREIPAMAEKIRAGLASRQGVVRELGADPERLLEEQAQDKADAERLGLSFTTDAAIPSIPQDVQE